MNTHWILIDPNIPKPEEKCCETVNIFTDEILEKCGNLIEGNQTDIDLQSTLLEDVSRKSFFTFAFKSLLFVSIIKCFLNCFFNETDILLDDGELNEETMQSYVNEVFAGTPDMIPIIEESLRICFHITASMRNISLPDTNCHYGNALIMNCLNLRMFMFCSETSWSNADLCNDAREYTDKCYPKFLYTEGN